MGYIFARRWCPAAMAVGLLLHGPADATPPGTVTLRVTRGFGAVPIAQRSAETRGNVIDLVRESVPIEATGGFVSAISGLRPGSAAGPNEDWFYFINGVLAPVGAAQYRPGPGDHIWWDLHPWSEHFQLGAVIGAFPEPFAHGYGGKVAPTRIYFARGFEGEASRIASRLREYGAGTVSEAPLTNSDPIDVEKSAPLLVGPWAALVAHPTIADLSRHWSKTGLLAEFAPGGATGRDWHGRTRRPPTPAGAILAAKTGARPGACLWLVTGTGDAEARGAAGILANEPESITGMGGLLIIDGRKIALPFSSTDSLP